MQRVSTMTCRVGRLFQSHTQMEPVCCCECSSTYLWVFFTSRAMGPHLCRMYPHSMVERRVAESMTPSPGRGQPALLVSVGNS